MLGTVLGNVPLIVAFEITSIFVGFVTFVRAPVVGLVTSKTSEVVHVLPVVEIMQLLPVSVPVGAGLFCEQVALVPPFALLQFQFQV